MNQVAVDENTELQFSKVYDERKAVLSHCSESMRGAMAALDRELLLCSQSLLHARQKWDDLDRKSQAALEIAPSTILAAGIIDFAEAAGL